MARLSSHVWLQDPVHVIRQQSQGDRLIWRLGRDESDGHCGEETLHSIIPSAWHLWSKPGAVQKLLSEERGTDSSEWARKDLPKQTSVFVTMPSSLSLQIWHKHTHRAFVLFYLFLQDGNEHFWLQWYLGPTALWPPCSLLILCIVTSIQNISVKGLRCVMKFPCQQFCGTKSVIKCS